MGGPVRVGAVLAAVACGFPVSASAATWGSPTKLTEADRADPQVAMSPSGEAVVVWGGRGSREIEATLRPPGGSFGAATLISHGRALRLTSSETGYAAAGWAVGGGGPGRSRLEIAVRPPRRPFGTPITVDGGSGPIGVDGAGNVTVVILEGEVVSGTEPSYRLAAVRVDNNGRIGPVREIARQKHISFSPSIAVSATGGVTVAWSGVPAGDGYDRARTFVADAPPGGEFGPPTAISDPAHGGADPRIASNARGDQLVVWGLPAGTEETPGSGQVPAGSFRPAGGRFGPVESVPVPDGGTRDLYSWDLAMSTDGDAVLAWSDGVSLSYSYRPAAGPFEAARAPAPYPTCCPGPRPPLRSEPAVGFDGGGNAMVLYTLRQPQPAGMHLEVVTRARGGRFGPPERVFSANEVHAPDVGLDAGGNAVAVWSPQESSVLSPDRPDTGVYAAYYDADAAPRIRRFELERARRPRFAFRSAATGRVRIAVERAHPGKPFRRLFVLRRLAVRGSNRVPLTGPRARALSRLGHYRATVTGRDQRGTRMKPQRLRFGPLPAR